MYGRTERGRHIICKTHKHNIFFLLIHSHLQKWMCTSGCQCHSQFLNSRNDDLHSWSKQDEVIVSQVPEIWSIERLVQCTWAWSECIAKFTYWSMAWHRNGPLFFREPMLPWSVLGKMTAQHRVVFQSVPSFYTVQYHMIFSSLRLSETFWKTSLPKLNQLFNQSLPNFFFAISILQVWRVPQQLSKKRPEQRKCVIQAYAWWRRAEISLKGNQIKRIPDTRELKWASESACYECNSCVELTMTAQMEVWPLLRGSHQLSNDRCSCLCHKE